MHEGPLELVCIKSIHKIDRERDDAAVGVVGVVYGGGRERLRNGGYISVVRQGCLGDIGSVDAVGLWLLCSGSVCEGCRGNFAREGRASRDGAGDGGGCRVEQRVHNNGSVFLELCANLLRYLKGQSVPSGNAITVVSVEVPSGLCVTDLKDLE